MGASLPASELKQALESQHGGTATLLQSVPVRESFGADIVWDGLVHEFKLAGHPNANTAYAWFYERQDGKRRLFTLLGQPPILSPVDAVRAAISAEQRITKPG